MEQKNSLVMHAQSTTSEPRSLSSEEAIRQFLVKAGEVYRQTLTAPLVSIWIDELKNYPASTLELAFRYVLHNCKFFPTPADVLEPLKAVEQADFESEWQSLLDYCLEWVHPDIHFNHAPELPVEIDHAARAAGGVYYLRECSQEELGWRKKAFIEDLTHSRKTGDLAGLLTGGELRKLLRQAAAPVAFLQDSRPLPSTLEISAKRIAAEKETIAKPSAPVRETPRVIDFEGRTAELQRQAEVIRQKYPKPGNSAGIPPELRPVEVPAQ